MYVLPYTPVAKPCFQHKKIDPMCIRCVSRFCSFYAAGSSENDVKEIPLPNMRSNVVAKVVEFCQHNKMDPMAKIPKVKNGFVTDAKYFGRNICCLFSSSPPRDPRSPHPTRVPRPRHTHRWKPFRVVEKYLQGVNFDFLLISYNPIPLSTFSARLNV